MTETDRLAPDVGSPEETLSVGPYAGRRLSEVAIIDPGYLADLVAEGIGTERLRAAAGQALLARHRTRAKLVRSARLRALRDRPIVRWALVGALGALAVVATGRSVGDPRALSFGGGAAAGTGRASALGVTAPAVTALAVPGAERVHPTDVPASGGAAPTTRAISVTGSAPCGHRLSGAVAAADAAAKAGTYQAVEFRVVGAKDTGRVTFLNSHDPYQGYFYVAIFPGDYDRFGAPPERLFAGRCIVVQGMIELYKGAPQIVLRHPDDVRVLPDEGEARPEAASSP